MQEAGKDMPGQTEWNRSVAGESDVAIIGAGPSGLFAVFECGMLGLKCAVFDSLPDIGGQCTALYPEKPIYDIPAAPEIMAGDLIANLERQAAPFHPSYHLGDQIVSLSKDSGSWLLKTAKGVVWRARAIIIAAGAGAFGPNRPPLAEIEQYEGLSVHYMVRRKEDFRDKKILIAGGGDSAVDWAVALAPLAAHVTVVHRRDKFRAAPNMVKQMDALAAQGKITLVVPYQLHELHGQNGILTKVSLISMEGDRRDVETDSLLAFFGLTPALGPIAEWGLSLNHHAIQVDPLTTETDITGIYAIGDIASYKNKLKLILTGFHEAALAAHAIRRQLNPGVEFHFEYSTTKGLPSSSPK